MGWLDFLTGFPSRWLNDNLTSLDLILCVSIIVLVMLYSIACTTRAHRK